MFPVDTIPLNTHGWKLRRYPCACGFISQSLKYPTSFLAPLAGNGCCSNFEPSWSSYLYLLKKSYPLLFLISTLTSATHFIFVPFHFSYLYLYPRYPWKVILIHTFWTIWGESLEPSSLDQVPHLATRFIPEMFPCQGNLQGVFTEEYTSTLTTML